MGEAEERLGLVHACHVCHGTGMEKVNYNHMILERNCEACDGMGIIQRKTGKSKSSTTATDQTPTEEIPLPGTQHRPPRQRRRSKTMFHHLFDWSAIDGISVSALPAVLLAAHARRARWLVVATCALCWL